MLASCSVVEPTWLHHDGLANGARCSCSVPRLWPTLCCPCVLQGGHRAYQNRQCLCCGLTGVLGLPRPQSCCHVTHAVLVAFSGCVCGVWVLPLKERTHTDGTIIANAVFVFSASESVVKWSNRQLLCSCGSLAVPVARACHMAASVCTLQSPYSICVSCCCCTIARIFACSKCQFGYKSSGAIAS